MFLELIYELRARKVPVGAQEAVGLSKALVAGLLESLDGEAARVLRALAIDPTAARLDAERALGQLPTLQYGTEVSIASNRLRNVLARAEAVRARVALGADVEARRTEREHLGAAPGRERTALVAVAGERGSGERRGRGSGEQDRPDGRHGGGPFP